MLRTPVSTAEVRLFRSQLLTSKEPGWGPQPPQRQIYLWFAAAIGLPLAGGWVMIRAFQAAEHWGLLVGFVIFLVVLADGLYLRHQPGSRRWREPRRRQPAPAPRTDPPNYPGLIFEPA